MFPKIVLISYQNLYKKKKIQFLINAQIKYYRQY